MSDAEDQETDASLDARSLDQGFAAANLRAETISLPAFSQSPLRPVQSERREEDSLNAFGNDSVSFPTVLPPTTDGPGCSVGLPLTMAPPILNEFVEASPIPEDALR